MPGKGSLKNAAGWMQPAEKTALSPEKQAGKTGAAGKVSQIQRGFCGKCNRKNIDFPFPFGAEVLY